MDVFERLGLGKLIDSSLGRRNASWNSFQYSEVVETLFCNYLCGGDCLEDINMLAPQFSLRPGTRVPNSDTVGRVLKSLATENISYACEKSGNTYSFNTAEELNTLLLKISILLLFCLFFLVHLVEEVLHHTHVAGIGIDVIEFALLVEEFIAGKGFHLQESFDGTLLFLGQIVVNTVFACQIVCLDDVLPFFIGSVVRQV